MTRIEYLTEEEQYKEILNNEEINRIKDYRLREIRSKYWGLRHKAFLDEHGVPNSELKRVFDSLCIREKREIDAYKRMVEEEPING